MNAPDSPPDAGILHCCFPDRLQAAPLVKRDMPTLRQVMNQADKAIAMLEAIIDEAEASS